MKIRERLRKLNNLFCQGMVCRVNLERDVAVFLLAVLASSVFLSVSVFSFSRKPVPVAVLSENVSDLGKIAGEEKISESILTSEEIIAEAEKIAKSVDTSEWKTFKNPYWGFLTKYPADWKAPLSVRKTAQAKWDARFQFRKASVSEGGFAGFDVSVYDVSKIKELRNTEEFPSLKSEELKNSDACQEIEGHALEIDEFPAQMIYISPKDECFQSVHFFTIVKERYIFTVAAIKEGKISEETDPRQLINLEFPEYLAAAGTLDLVEIVRPKPVPPKPKITAPRPVSFKKSNGKLVCAKKNDKPRKSKKDKGKHLDMECCLDPDEYPNPWCTY